jgi:hypothetical protein
VKPVRRAVTNERAELAREAAALSLRLLVLARRLSERPSERAS